MASELFSLLPGGRLKIFHHCMVGTCCEFNTLFFFNVHLLFSNFAYADLKFKHEMSSSV